jgi:hypothetical protein
MSGPSRVILLAGFDYQGGRVDFVGMARNRQARLLARNSQLVVTIMDVGSGVTTISALTPDAAGNLARRVTSSKTNDPVTAANYSHGLRHETRFDQNQGAQMSITDLYAAVQAIGGNKDTAGTLVEVSVFSHGYIEGPILVDSDDYSTTASRDRNDKDGRVDKDFTSANMNATQLAAFRAAFAADAIWWNWGCTFANEYRQTTHRLIHSPLYLRTPPGTLKDTEKIKFDFPQDMADKFYAKDSLFFPQTKRAGGKNAGQFKDLVFERTVKEVKEFFKRGVRKTYHFAVAQAAGIPVRGAFLGTYADYESNDKSIKLPLMEIPRNVRIFGNDFSGYLRMWVKDLGFAMDPENHGYGIYPP